MRARFALALAALSFGLHSYAATNIFGPKSYAVTTGAPQTIQDTFTAGAACNGSMSFVLRVENDGVASAEVSVNGVAILGASDFSAATGVLELPLRLELTNRIDVTVRGGKKNGRVTLTIRQEVEQDAATKRYALTSKKQTFRDTIPLAGTGGAWVLFVENGPSGAASVAKGSIALNGVTVIDWSKNTALMRRAVAVRAANDVTVDLSGDSGAAISVSLRQVADESICTPVVAISTPPAGETIHSAVFHATGIAAGGRDLGVMVNGRAAELDLAHTGSLADPYLWSAEVYAADGPLTITAIARNAAGLTVAATRDVGVSIDATSMRLIAEVPSAVAPASIRFQLDGVPDGATKYEADLDGNGSFEIVSASEPALAASYATPGLRRVTVRVTSPAGVRTATAFVSIADFGTLDTLLQQRWSSFRAALARRDVPAALLLMAGEEAREKYGELFTLLLERLPAISATMDPILPVSINGEYAKYLLTRVEDGRTFGYSVYFIRDEDGVWRIAQF